MATAIVPLLETTLTSSGLIDIVSISQDYRDLILVVTKYSGDIRTSLNLNSGGTYYEVDMQGTGTTPGGAYDASLTYVWANLYNSGGSADSVTTFFIPEYSVAGKDKIVLTRGSVPTNIVSASFTRWSSSDAVTGLSISPALPTNSTVCLYGVKS